MVVSNKSARSYPHSHLVILVVLIVIFLTGLSVLVARHLHDSRQPNFDETSQGQIHRDTTTPVIQ